MPFAYFHFAARFGILIHLRESPLPLGPSFAGHSSAFLGGFGTLRSLGNNVPRLTRAVFYSIYPFVVRDPSRMLPSTVLRPVLLIFRVSGLKYPARTQ